MLCVASSGIASLLLSGGQTAHSRFKIPIPIHEDSVCKIPPSSDLANLIRQTSHIIWDEVPMQHRHCAESVDRTLQDIMKNGLPFGGITVVFGGDFKQIPPVVPRAGREQIVDASLQRSRLWRHVEVLHLRQNMLLDQDPENADFAEWLLGVGNGTINSPEGLIQLKEGMRCDGSVQDLIDTVYPQVDQPQNDQYFLDRTILSS